MTAVPSTGCQFNRWSGDIDTGAANNASISVVMDRDRTIIADFIGCEGPYDITVAASTYMRGPITINASFGVITCSASPSSMGTVVNVTAIAAKGYRFDGWKGDITGSRENMSLVANSYEAITAEFSKISFPSWLWVIVGIVVFLLIGLLIYRFKSERARKMKALQSLDNHIE